ncbi:MAG: family 10 glycosylhydrolase [Clostridia bacterium]|nr:family 10 glycosylhydrolase [Clostridia bacterium]
MRQSLFLRLLLLSLILCAFLLTACSDSPDEAQTDTGTGQPEQSETVEETDMTDTDTIPATEPVTEPVTEAPTESPTEAPTEAPTEPETDPVREPLELALDFEPFVPDSPAELHDVKAMWLSQFDMNNLYVNGGKQRDEASFRKLLDTLLQNVYDSGFNTLFVQVRPNADSIYPSEIYPPSVYAVGKYGNDFEYDPFAIIVEAARSYGFSIHAWINPMRGVTPAEMKLIPEGYDIRAWYEDDDLRGRYLVEYGGRIYLNPAYAEVRDMIVYGAREILQKYDVDGVHMDDYFYPSEAAASFDADAYAAYKAEGGRASLQNWRRLNLSALVSSLYRMTKREGKDLLFGISPAGVLNTVQNKQYADVTRWCKEPGFIDYILPQDYFGFEHATVPFDEVCHTWEDLIETDYVTLLIGMSFGKALSKTDQYAGSGKNEWAQHNDIMVRSLQYTCTLEKCRGISVFCYQYYYDPVSGKPVAGTQTERDKFTPELIAASWEN